MIRRQYLHLNRAFSLSDERGFVELMLRDVPPRPPNAAEIRAANLGGAAPVI